MYTRSQQLIFFSVLDLPEERLEFECFYSHIERWWRGQPQLLNLVREENKYETLFLVDTCNTGGLSELYPPRACWMTSLAHSMMRKGRLFWSQRKRQRSSDKEVLGSPESRSESGGSRSGSEFEWCCCRLCPCGWEWEWLWEFTLHLLDEEAPPDSPAPPVMGTRTSLLSGLAAAAPGTGVLVTSSGCRVRDKPFPAWAPRSLESGCITVGDSLSFSALLESLLWHEGQQHQPKCAHCPESAGITAILTCSIIFS